MKNCLDIINVTADTDKNLYFIFFPCHYALCTDVIGMVIYLMITLDQSLMCMFLKYGTFVMYRGFPL